jgi:putative flippase GtrA
MSSLPSPDSATGPEASGNATRHGRLGTMLRYGAGSIVATICSEVAFLICYGPLDAGPAWSSFVGWLAGAVPNYILNRSWAWGRRGRPSLRYEVLPYVAIVVVTLALAVLATTLAETGLNNLDVTDTARTILVGIVFLGVYLAVFVVRFFLFDRLFTRDAPQPGSARVGRMSEGGDD